MRASVLPIALVMAIATVTLSPPSARALPAPGSASGVEGIVYRWDYPGGIRPVDWPRPLTFPLTLTFTAVDGAQYQALSGGDGAFLVYLSPGQYQVTASVPRAGRGMFPTAVQVPEGRTLGIRLFYDAGVR
jgi:hypothetical protein